MSVRRPVGQKAKSRFKEIMGRYIDGIGRNVVVYLSGTVSECSNCYYDKVNDRSSGIPKSSPSSPNYFVVGRCPVCLGKGKLITERRKSIKCVIVWNPIGDSMNSLTFNEAGYEGATIVEIKTDVCNLDILKQCDYVKIDGVKCVLAKPPIMRGIGNKSTLVAYFFTETKSRVSSGEFV